ncbi:hypothetical protein [Kineosporia babensis]|uniref:Uncharacterized protein n=1 Tax=Kineosporia babensis TaxID=499548 RepID=A0A9X1ST31_9ACTN|nr:hypothetical protein [Kineosporia babensis]MCD5310180.1 hypothetical protein [Kineosporia babensis]
MSRTEEISSDVKAVSAAAEEVRNRAEEALEFARNEIDTAYEHGWDGVGQSINIAGEALEKIVEELDSTSGTFENVAKSLDAISEQMSHNEVAEQLALTMTEIDAGHETMQGTSELVEEALTGADQAEHQSLGTRLHKLREEVEKLAGQLQQSRSDIESEHEQAEKMGQQEADAEAKKREDEQGQEKDDEDRRDEDGDRRSGRAAQS